jgi:hypothetical protein
MLTTLLLGAAVGGAVAFVWGAVSWMVLPWHHRTFRRFRDEDAVARAIADNAPASGVYGLPSEPAFEKGVTPEQRKAAEAATWEKMKAGPLVLAVVQRRGFPTLAKPMLGALAINALASLLLTALLLHTAGLGYWERAAFVGLAAFAGAVICRLTDWNWHGYATDYTLVALVDVAVGWLLVGLALAALT